MNGFYNFSASKKPSMRLEMIVTLTGVTCIGSMAIVKQFERFLESSAQYSERFEKIFNQLRLFNGQPLSSIADLEFRDGQPFVTMKKEFDGRYSGYKRIRDLNTPQFVRLSSSQCIHHFIDDIL